MIMTHKKLYRIKEGRIFGGIFSGLSEYLDVDITVLRLLWVFVLIVTGIVPGILVYIVGLFIVPQKPL